MKKLGKTFVSIIPLCALFSLTGCNNENKTFTVTWKNYDGTILETDLNVNEGTNPEYNGLEPTKQGDKQYSYIWNGWSPELRPVTEDVVYVAQFNPHLNTYTVTWKNYDGTILETDSDIPYGTTPSYDGSDPIRQNDTKYSYTWKGWTPTIKEVDGDAIYTAYFSSENNKYNVYITVNDESRGTVTGAGIHKYHNTVTITATPSEDFIFGGWYSDEYYSNKLSGEKTYKFDMPDHDITYYAKFLTKEEAQIEWNLSHGVVPIINKEMNTLIYGLYPQTYIDYRYNLSLINELKRLSPSPNGWYFYNDEYYAKLTANPCHSSYTFSDGTSIIKGQEYWFKCEPIEWNILRDDNNKLSLLSSFVLDVKRYNESYSDKKNGYYANNYMNSEIRAWLNNDFYNSAFYLGNTNILSTIVDNSFTFSDEKDYACPNTNDKVFLLSYNEAMEYLPEGTGGAYPSILKCKPTDYALANQCEMQTTYSDKGHSYYWTRSAAYFSYYAYYINSSGYPGAHDVASDYLGVRPALNIEIN